jgi:hypothetical protein
MTYEDVAQLIVGQAVFENAGEGGPALNCDALLNRELVFSI